MADMNGDRLPKARNLIALFKPECPWPDSEASTGHFLQKYGRKSCWEAVGKARDNFGSPDGLAEEIKRYLTRCSESVPATVTWSLYMIGRTRQTAHPTVVFCCKDTEPRRTVRQTVKRSGILEKYPGFLTMDCTRPPGCTNLESLAANEPVAQASSRPDSTHFVLLRLQSEDVLGAKVCVRKAGTDAETSRTATAGDILEWEGRQFITTVAHVFSRVELDIFPQNCTSGENEFDLDSSNDSDDDDNTVMITSNGSMTSGDVDSRSSIKSLYSTSSPFLSRHKSQQSQTSISSTKSQQSQTSISSTASDRKDEYILPGEVDLDSNGVGLEIPAGAPGNSDFAMQLSNATSSDEIHDFQEFNIMIALEQEGSFASSKAITNSSLDYALIDITALDLRTSNTFLLQDQPQAHKSVAKSEANGCAVSTDIIAVTASNGAIRGRMSGTPSFMQLPFVAVQQELWTIHCNGDLAKGDCGSWIYDANSGVVYGQIIAGSPGFGFAYVMPLHQILSDIRQRFEGRWKIATDKAPLIPSHQNAMTKFSNATVKDIQRPLLNDKNRVTPVDDDALGIGWSVFSESQQVTARSDQGWADDSIIQDFTAWSQSPEVVCLEKCGDGFRADRPFIPYTILEAQFDRPHQIRRLLTALFPHKTLTELPDSGLVRFEYLRVFSILLCIGRGRSIFEFIQQRLLDKLLPFQNTDVLARIKDPDIASAFFQRQWAFCAPVFGLNLDKHFSKDWVLPILRKEKLSGGYNASVYKILVHEAYNQLHYGTNYLDPSSHHSNTFVLKTYRGPDAEQNYNTEKAAFQKLQQTGLQDNIVSFYGNFVRDKTYNVILEYADEGTLEGFLKKTQPPSTSKDIISFWNSLFGIYLGLTAIHEAQDADSKGIQMLARHSDVKPANILLFSKRRDSCYDLQFKLADLGLHHFKKAKSPNKNMHEGTYPNHAYSAHYQSKPTTASKISSLATLTNDDIWSLGCLFYEVAVWVSCGWETSRGYRQRLENRRTLSSDFQDEDFPIGKDMLDIVHDMHRNIRQQIRLYDFVTGPVLKMINENMLVSQESQSRRTARQLHSKASRIIIVAERRLEGYPAEQPFSREMKTGTGTTLSLHTMNSSQSFPRSSLALSALSQSHINHLRDSPFGAAHSAFSRSGAHPMMIKPPKANAARRRKLSSRSSPQAGPPYLSMEAALKWKQDKKSGRLPALPNEKYLEKLKGRDHIFLIDDSESLKEHWREVQGLFEILSYMVKKRDPDGIDLYFTTSNEKHNAKKTSKLSRQLEKRQPHGTSDMERSLRFIIEKYREPHKRARRLFLEPNKQRPKEECPRTLYILTDSKWPPVASKIDSMVREFNRDKPSFQPWLFQFIQFGHGADDTCQLEGLPSDIVDTEPANGNVWKMLLGAVNTWYDCDA